VGAGLSRPDQGGLKTALYIAGLTYSVMGI
jgi:hypothetical protein